MVAVEEIAGRVADALDEGLIPWRMKHLPRSVYTGRVYGGVNPILLQIAAARLGLWSPFWGTARQWRSLGVEIRQATAHGVRLCPGVVVFDLEQTDRRCESPALAHSDPAPIFDTIVRNGCVQIDYVLSAECKYLYAEDKIRMPHRLMFEIGPGGASGYYDALGHELMHWSEVRMRWDAHPDVSELRAEVGSGYLLAALGVTPLPPHLARHHRKYAPRWAQLLRSQPGLLVKVCDSVTATLDYLLGLASVRVCWCQPDD